MMYSFSRICILVTFIGIVITSCKEAMHTSLPEKEVDIPKYAIVIHGGAGTISKSTISPDQEEAIRAALGEALDIGAGILKEGGSSLDAVEKTINHLENSPLFNAGKGAVFTHDGKNELDASIMQGHTKEAGAVGGVTTVKNPISAARAVMEKSVHVMMVGQGADAFSKEQGLEIVDPTYFYTENRKRTLDKMLSEEKNKVEKHGTVGCVALDQNGHITAGTSTGGMTNKRYNRIGDSPIIGAGTYADANCGISCTGHGEYFIRYTVARDIAALVALKGMSLSDAADEMIHHVLKDIGGDGGVIALDTKGNIAWPFNTQGMYRGYVKEGEEKNIALYSE